MDWVSIIRDEAQNSSILRADDLARKYKIVPAAVAQALSRQEEKGLVEHISRKIYLIAASFRMPIPGDSQRPRLRSRRFPPLDAQSFR
jgi:predicted transcriptional regulator of viral defense system